MTGHLNPKPSEIMERCKFNVAKQEANESVAEFTTRLKKMATHCNFENIKVALRDQFVSGLKDHDTKAALFRIEKLDYETAVKEAVIREAAEKNATNTLQVLENKSAKSEVFALQNSRKPGRWNMSGGNPTKPHEQQRPTAGSNQQQHNQQPSSEQGIVCYCCGKPNHTSKWCRYREFTCHNCDKKGHLKIVCRKGSAGSTQQLKLMQEDSGAALVPETAPHCNEFHKLDLSDEYEYVKYVSGKDGAEPMFVDLTVNGTKVRMELDTGTYATVISEKCFNECFRMYKLVKTERNFKVYNGDTLKPIGKLTNLTVELESKTRILECFILPGTGPALIGRQWLQAFGLWPLRLRDKDENSLNKIDVENVANYFFKKYSELFSDTPGMYNKSKTKIHLKTDARPIALKCIHVAHALKPLIEKELDRLVKLGHLEPVETSEWATPIVPVFKSNGNIRLCGDFKLTLNPYVIIDKYPLHTIDEIFANMQGGTLFSELDLTHAYMQFPVDEECLHLLTIVTHKGLFRYKNIPEGVSPAPADVQKKMDECLRGIDGAIAYLDNIYVTGRTKEEHKANLEKPNVAETVEEKQRAQIVSRAARRKVEVAVGDDVMVDDYGIRADKRTAGKIVKQTSPSTYDVQTDKGAVQKRHIDQIVKGKANEPWIWVDNMSVIEIELNNIMRIWIPRNPHHIYMHEINIRQLVNLARQRWVRWFRTIDQENNAEIWECSGDIDIFGLRRLFDMEDFEEEEEEEHW
ncbi:uncharacterized protein [Temnothorax longispinosus]|uniref:uncharacterized protein n=1 Tax=Temnothorax longispinosus TaxID=300112 RepID=UPI003A9A439B